LTGVSGWTLTLEVPKAAVDIFDRGLAPISVATSAFEINGSNFWRIEAFAVERPDENAVVGAVALAAELAGIAEPEVHVLALPAIDWVAENQKSFEPIVAGRFFIHPTHYDGRIPWAVTSLAVDAGPAFGTGSHGSTMGCLLALNHLSHHPPPGPILDLGCGTGILAMAIARRWQRHVLAADIDPDAVATAQINARLNGLKHFVRVIGGNGPARGVIRRNGPYGLIVANILARPLIVMAQDIKRALASGGTLILSGFTKNQANAVRAAYPRRDYHLARKEDSGGWTTFVLTRFGGRGERRAR